VPAPAASAAVPAPASAAPSASPPEPPGQTVDVGRSSGDLPGPPAPWQWPEKQQCLATKPFSQRAKAPPIRVARVAGTQRASSRASGRPVGGRRPALWRQSRLPQSALGFPYARGSPSEAAERAGGNGFPYARGFPCEAPERAGGNGFRYARGSPNEAAKRAGGNGLPRAGGCPCEAAGRAGGNGFPYARGSPCEAARRARPHSEVPANVVLGVLHEVVVLRRQQQDALVAR
jgi:hypothetical protein